LLWLMILNYAALGAAAPTDCGQILTILVIPNLTFHKKW